jgi:hypothetical protein
VLMGGGENDQDGQACLAIFREEAQKLGWAENRNARIDTHWSTPTDLAAVCPAHSDFCRWSF